MLTPWIATVEKKVAILLSLVKCNNVTVVWITYKFIYLK